MLVNAITLLKKKKTQKKAVGAFNVSSLETLQAIFESASEKSSEVIIETSRGESEHFMPKVLFSITEELSNLYGVNYILHLDRSDDLSWMKRCLDAGYNSISAEFNEKDYTKNLELTLKARDLTKKYKAQLEGVLEVVPLVYYNNEMLKDMTITDPEIAKRFVIDSKCDSLVVSIGTQSGKFKSLSNIRIDILKKINRLLPDVPLVLHGGSFLEKNLIRSLIDEGITKININSELRIKYAEKLKGNIFSNPDEYAPYRLLKGVKDELKQVVKTKIKNFNNE
ncbi:class II fructose-bisphosphate aldolase [Candidatus Dojkabacteria bacterium]|nr:class II fructose-bisphosphate aldolase [Candidatus Dojkabacteria bacterium]